MSRYWELELPFNRPVMTPNEQRRAHWTTVRMAKDKVQSTTAWIARSKGIPCLDRVEVDLRWYPPDRRRRDPDSLSVMAKACLDGLVQAGVLWDDSSLEVASVNLSIAEKSDRVGISLVIREVDG